MAYIGVYNEIGTNALSSSIYFKLLQKLLKTSAQKIEIKMHHIGKKAFILIHRSSSFTASLLFVLTLLIMQPGKTDAASLNKTAYDVANTDRPRIGLVLSGGGALGLAHIGVLQVMQELRVPVDCVVGTSMGALVGGTYAAGVDPDSLEKAVTSTDLNALFDDNPARSEIAQKIKQDEYRPLFDFTLGYNDGVSLPAGASAGYKFELFLKELIGPGASVYGQNFNQLSVPYRAIATDLETGEMKVFSEGELARVMRASMSLPSILAPAEIGGHAYIDGGLVRNLPVEVGRELCGDVIIAVNLGTKPKTKDQVSSSLDVAMQSIVILTEQNVKGSLQALNPDDVLIEPEAGEYTSSSFASQREIIENGRRAAMLHQDELSRLSVTAEEYQRWWDRRSNKIPAPSKAITAITAEVAGTVNEEAVQSDIRIKPGEKFDNEELNREITNMYGRGDFSYVGYSTIPDDDEAAVIIRAKSKPWGPGYLKFGMGTITDFSSPTQFNLAASYRRTWVNSLGAEWRTDMQIGYDTLLKTEFIQPLQIRDGAFLDPYLLVRRSFIQLYSEDIRLGDFDIERYQAGLDAGITGRIGELRIGGFANNVTTKPGLGAIDPLFVDTHASQTGLQIRGIIDQLDSYKFPTSGLFVLADIRTVKQYNDTPADYTRAQLELKGAMSFGNNTLAGKIEWGDELSGKNDLPVFEVFELGGPNRLSGLFLDQLTGTRYQLATLNYYYRYASLPTQLGRGAYIGFSLEAGRINDPFMQGPWDATHSASLYWGADTILGAVYIGYGYSDLGQNSLYLMIGPRF